MMTAEVLKDLGLCHINESIDEATRVVKDRMEGRNLPLKTKWHKFNRMLGGGIDPEYGIYTIASRAGIGKSAFANNLLFSLYEQNRNDADNLITLYFNFEMPNYMQILRETSSRFQYTVSELLSVDNPINQQALFNMNSLKQSLGQYKFYFCEQALTVFGIYTVALRVREANPNARITVLIDHSRLVRNDREKAEIERIEQLSLMMVRATKELKIPFILLSQLNRNIEDIARAASLYVPVASDVFGSDAVYQASTHLIMLQRPEIYNLPVYLDNTDAENLLAVHFVKNRNGDLGWIPFDANFAVNNLIERTNG